MKTKRKLDEKSENVGENRKRKDVAGRKQRRRTRREREGRRIISEKIKDLNRT
jgi:hypothetical protein